MMSIRNRLELARKAFNFHKLVDKYYYEHREECLRDKLLYTYECMEMDRVYKMYVFMGWDTSKLPMYELQ
jgi:hypothetical protein